MNELWVMMSNEGYPSFVGQYDLTIDIAYARVFRDDFEAQASCGDKKFEPIKLSEAIEIWERIGK